jgi:hypothetical protein
MLSININMTIRLKIYLIIFLSVPAAGFPAGAFAGDQLLRVNSFVSIGHYKWGYIDRNGREVIKPVFDAAGSFHEGAAWAAVNGRWGIINTAGKFLLEPCIDYAEDFEGSSAFFFNCTEYRNGVCIRKGWGLVNNKGRIVIPARFDSVKTDFSRTLDEADRITSMDMKKKRPLPDLFSRESGELSTRSHYFWKDGYARVCMRGSSHTVESCGLVNREGRLLIDPLENKFHSIDSFYSGLAKAEVIKTDDTGKYRGTYPALIKPDGEIVLMAHGGTIELIRHPGEKEAEGIWLVTRRFSVNGKKTAEYYSRKGVRLFADRKFIAIKGFYNGYSWARDEGGNWGLIDSRGEQVIIPAYDSVELFREGAAFVSAGSGQERRHSLIDYNGKVISGFDQYSALCDFNGRFGFMPRSSIPAYRKSGSVNCAMADRSGKILADDLGIISPGCGSGFLPEGPYIKRIYKGESRGYIAADGKVIRSDDLNYAYFPGDEVLWFSRKEIYGPRKEEGIFWGFADMKGNVIKYPASLESGYFSDGVSWYSGNLRLKGSEHITYWGLLDRKGVELMEPMFYTVNPFRNGIASCMAYGGTWGYVTAEGKILWWSAASTGSRYLDTLIKRYSAGL